jgi:hypothetical protein
MLCKGHNAASWGSRFSLHVPRVVPWRLHAIRHSHGLLSAMGICSMGIFVGILGVYKGGEVQPGEID